MDVLTQLLAVALVMGLLALAVWGLHRGRSLHLSFAGRRRQSGRLLESIERLQLSPHHALHLVRVGEETILLAVHSGGCSRIATAGALAPRSSIGDCPRSGGVR